jgi:hypothetical protein
MNRPAVQHACTASNNHPSRECIGMNRPAVQHACTASNNHPSRGSREQQGSVHNIRTSCALSAVLDAWGLGGGWGGSATSIALATSWMAALCDKT